jgi:two-component system NarL family sensor kinase
MASIDDKVRDTVVSAVERRLARLCFDLHDGPLQEVHLLAMDVALFREQLQPSLEHDPNGARLLGRLDDVSARLLVLDDDLRRLSTSLKSPFMRAGSFEAGLRETIESFTSRTGLEPTVELSGDLPSLTESQQITVLAVITEALSNAREHSQARQVSIVISVLGGGVDAQVIDDGVGFDPEVAMSEGSRNGHLGLVGMHERVRLLGGQTNVYSQPGGPTVVSLILPQWTP